MKKKFILGLLFIAPLLLGGCGNGESTDPTSAEPTSTVPTKRHMEDVCNDISENLGIEIPYFVQGYYKKAINYSIQGVDYSDTKPASGVLFPVVSDLYSKMPEYLTLYEFRYYATGDDYWGDNSGDTVFRGYLKVDQVSVLLLSYCYNDCLMGEVTISEN